MLDVTSKEPIYCTLEPNERNGDGMSVWFAADKTERDFENRGCFQLIRQSVEDSTSRKKSRVTPKWSKAYKGFRGRLIESKQVDFGQVQEWLHLCETSHGSTCSRNGLVSSAACKIRLIDVTNRQIVDGATNNRYLALSYVWGPWRQFCLSKENHGDLRAPHGLKDDKMPTTIKDAFDVVTRLGERYLRVDRLCILVDGDQDKLEQMSNMDLIYSAAVLTIVNASARCANASIPGVRQNTRQIHQHSEVIRGVRFITTQPDLVSAVHKLNWSTRAWTFQEGFLSARCLVFTPYQVYFRCKSEVWCEDSCWIGSRLLEPKPPIGNALCHLRDYSIGVIRCGFCQYTDAVQAFSMRQLTVETDALWAFTGVTKAFKPQLQEEFVWVCPLDISMPHCCGALSPFCRSAERLTFSNCRPSYDTTSLPELVMGFLG
jgi:hypothetical protein